jgi:hypothetical protein
MTMQMAIQIILTVLVTGTCTVLAMTFVTIAKDAVKLQKWFSITVRSMFLLHLVLLPAALINLIWSV